MDINSSDLDEASAYKLLTGMVVPRPIAWVTTLSATGGVNLAPFSAFTFVSNKPPMVGINVGRNAGVLKDTGNNILAGKEFVVHIANDALVEQVHQSSFEYEAHISEVTELGLETVPGTRVRVPRLLIAPISMECRLHRSIPFGDAGSEFMVGEVLCFHVNDELLRNGKVDSALLKPLCRLAGPKYARLGEILDVTPVRAV